MQACRIEFVGGVAVSSDVSDKRCVKTVHELLGGRYSAGPSAIMEEINASIDVDKRLYEVDILASKAHASMLAARRIIEECDAAAIDGGLDQVRAEIESGQFFFSRSLEDIHMHVEARLTEIIGAAAGRLHTARSRNDQVATDLRLWTRSAVDQLDGGFQRLITALLGQAEAHADTVMPGYTHLQPAQPVTFGHHCMAYVEMFFRDRARFRDARERLNECPLGAAALAGTSFPIDRDQTARELGFDRPAANSLDAVSDRDFVLETVSAASLAAMHLSRLAEELVIWTSPQFHFVSLPEDLTTGSSIMPQKRNPDAAELLRAKSGRIVGSLVGLLTVMKGLPLAYSRDMQEDKEHLFSALDSLSLSLAAMTAMVERLTPDRDAMRRAANVGFITATDIADWLVCEEKITFREAHRIVGRLVRLAEDKGLAFADLSSEDFQAVSPLLTPGLARVLRVEDSVASRNSQGGTAPVRVREAIAAARRANLPDRVTMAELQGGTPSNRGFLPDSQP